MWPILPLTAVPSGSLRFMRPTILCSVSPFFSGGIPDGFVAFILYRGLGCRPGPEDRQGVGARGSSGNRSLVDLMDEFRLIDRYTRRVM